VYIRIRRKIFIGNIPNLWERSQQFALNTTVFNKRMSNIVY